MTDGPKFVTSVSLSKAEHLAVMELHICDLLRGRKKSTMREIFVEGLRSALSKSGRTLAQIDELLREAPKPPAKILHMGLAKDNANG